MPVEKLEVHVPARVLDEMAPGDIYHVAGRGPKDVLGGARIILLYDAPPPEQAANLTELRARTACIRESLYCNPRWPANIREESRQRGALVRDYLDPYKVDRLLRDLLAAALAEVR